MSLIVTIELTEEQLKKIAEHIASLSVLNTNVKEEEEFLTVNQVSLVLQVSRNTVINLIKDNLLAAHKIGKQWRVSRKNLTDYVNS